MVGATIEGSDSLAQAHPTLCNVAAGTLWPLTRSDLQLPLESFDVTFTLDEERSMLDDHFAKIKMDLGYAGLAPSTYFWQKKFKSRINKPEKEVTEGASLSSYGGEGVTEGASLPSQA